MLTKERTGSQKEKREKHMKEIINEVKGRKEKGNEERNRERKRNT
jgi:hypothetical protein